MLKVMISHEHREAPLAGIWKDLLDGIGQGRIIPWYSSDRAHNGGMGTGEWWGTLHEQVQRSDYMIAVLTRESQSRPWITWECGLGRASPNVRGIVPVLFDFSASDLRGPLAGFQSYRGDHLQSVHQLCRLLLQAAELDLPDSILHEHLQIYLAKVNAYCTKDSLPRLYGEGFHRPDHSLSGHWDCTWYDENGSVFEKDQLELIMRDDRVRIIGHGAKGFEYPMEGRLSCMRYLALNYWSLSHIATCGVVLLRINPTGTKMKGEWVGHSARDYEEDELSVLRGAVEATKVSSPAGA